MLRRLSTDDARAALPCADDKLPHDDDSGGDGDELMWRRVLLIHWHWTWAMVGPALGRMLYTY